MSSIQEKICIHGQYISHIYIRFTCSTSSKNTCKQNWTGNKLTGAKLSQYLIDQVQSIILD